MRDHSIKKDKKNMKTMAYNDNKKLSLFNLLNVGQDVQYLSMHACWLTSCYSCLIYSEDQISICHPFHMFLQEEEEEEEEI
jgi:hypothetical protein